MQGNPIMCKVTHVNKWKRGNVHEVEGKSTWTSGTGVEMKSRTSAQENSVMFWVPSGNSMPKTSNGNQNILMKGEAIKSTIYTMFWWSFDGEKLIWVPSPPKDFHSMVPPMNTKQYALDKNGHWSFGDNRSPSIVYAHLHSIDRACCILVWALNLRNGSVNTCFNDLPHSCEDLMHST